MIEYGIQNENSHIRAHVCPIAKRIYVYKTIHGIEAIKTGKYRKVSGYQDGVSFSTSEGFIVPPFDIRGCVSLCISNKAWGHMDFSESDSTTRKGKKAERLIHQMILNGMFPIPALSENVTDKDIQIDGCDIIIRGNGISREDIIIQVKCDFPGGEKQLGGTGNLFLQVAEINPLHKH